MHITELNSFKLSDAVKFHNRLNPKIWGRDEHLLPEVREKLTAIADNFREFLGVSDLDVRDITISGSNAAYSYTPHSDIDLHLVVNFPADNEVYQELFNAKKYQFNDEHNLAIGGIPVELYVQNAAESPVSQGEYSISREEWIQVPRRKRAQIDDTCVRAKVEDLDARIHSAIDSGNAENMGRLWHKITAMRQSGLDAHGEFGCENIVFKILRNKGCIKDLRAARTAAQDHELSLKEQNRPQVRKVWGFAEGHQGQPYSSPDGVAAGTHLFLNEDNTQHIVHEFIQYTAKRLGIERMPEIQLHNDDAWSEQNRSFGMYRPEQHVLHVNMRNRHVMDILRTVAHELAHCRQHELEQLDHTSGETGSPIENEAHAVAGIIMREYAQLHPEYFEPDRIAEGNAASSTGGATVFDPKRNTVETVDVESIQNDMLREYLLSNPALYEDREDFRAMREFLNLHTTSRPLVNRQYVYARVLTTPVSQFVTVAHFDQAYKLVELDDQFAYFEINGTDKKFPETGNLTGDALSQVYFFKSTNELDQFITLLQLKFSHYKQTAKILDQQSTQQSVAESSGYIPTWAQANDPRFEMALSVDVQPGQTGTEANKMRLATDAQGHPQLLRPDGRVSLAESLAKEFELFEEQDLFEINMGSKSLRREAAQTGAIAGMEFEMIVPGVKSADSDMEPDYDQDERVRDIDDAVNFFDDGDYNGRREVDQLRRRMENDFQEWLTDKVYSDWERSGKEYLEEWVANNVDESEWNPDELEGEARTQALEEFIANKHSDPGSSDAFDEFREEQQYAESDWLGAEDLGRMSGIENAYEISWPYWTSGSGDVDTDEIAGEFGRAVGREVRVNTRYHQSGDRPGPNNQFYIVEPDSSLHGTNGDEGLEFVSPPMPLDELLKDLNAVKSWAGRNGVYTNDSTGLHINISVPDYSLDKLDFVKLALLMGDEYVLNQFGRSSNIYAKSALGMVRDRVRKNPQEAEKLLNKMKGQMGELASKAIHSGSTDKYTSINTKDGHIEFRSPGGDWLDDNFDKIENTLLRFTVAMSAALNPEAYREEYQKKLYKLLTQDQKDSDTIRYFSDYVAGKIPKAALRSFVKQAQLERQIKRGETGNQKMWWRVGRPGYSGSVEVVATAKDQAIALGKQQFPEWDYATDLTAVPVSPYEEQPAAIEQGSATTGNWGIWAPSFDRFSTIRDEGPRRFIRQADAQAWIQDYNTRNTGNDIELTVRVIDTAPTADTTDAALGGIIDVTPIAAQPVPGSTLDRQQQRQQAAAGTFSGAWQVLDPQDREIYRFSGVGNNQSDANRVAMDWLRQNPGRMQAGVTVVPIMTEGLSESASDYELHDRPKLDGVLAKCCRMVVQGQQRDSKRYGQVAACVIDPDNQMVYGINLPGPNGTRRHAERVAIDKYTKAHGDIPEGSIVVTTCSPCNSPMTERHGESCKDLLNSAGIHRVYAGYQDPTQHDDSDADFRVYVTENDQLWSECQQFAQSFLGKETLSELFDAKTSFPLKWDNQFASSGEVHAEALDADGRSIDISFTPGDNGELIEIVFKRGGSYDLTGKGDAARVMATVVNAIDIYLQKYQPLYVAFSAKSTGGRASVYAAMIKRLARDYKLLQPDQYPAVTNSFVEFIGSDQPFVLARQ